MAVALGMQVSSKASACTLKLVSRRPQEVGTLAGVRQTSMASFCLASSLPSGEPKVLGPAPPLALHA